MIHQWQIWVTITTEPPTRGILLLYLPTGVIYSVLMRSTWYSTEQNTGLLSTVITVAKQPRRAADAFIKRYAGVFI